MMKINHDPSINRAAFPELSKPAIISEPLGGKTSGADFQSLLKSASAFEPRKSAVPKAAMDRLTGEISALSPTAITAAHLVDKTAIVQQTGALLDFLEKYRASLNDPKFSLKKLDSLLQAMQAEKDRMLPLIEVLPANDGLKDVLNRVLIDITLESIRFERGDYLI